MVMEASSNGSVKRKDKKNEVVSAFSFYPVSIHFYKSEDTDYCLDSVRERRMNKERKRSRSMNSGPRDKASWTA